MTRNSSALADHDEQLGNILAAWLEAVEAGEAPDSDAWRARHPEFAAEMAEFFATQKNLGAVAEPLRAVARAAVTSTLVGEGLPRVFGDFEVEEEIGRGGMGVVYKARQKSLNRRVALKVLPFAATMDPRHLRRFLNEAQAAASLHHTNIVPVYFVGSDRGVHYYAMQYIEGRDLARIIADLRSPSEPGPSGGGENLTALYTPLPNGRGSDSTQAVADFSTERTKRPLEYFRTVARLGIQAAEALDHAHQMGIVHRDIKPANLLVDDAGQLWVTDFGLAQMQSDTRLTMTGDLIGTLRYMSPEQALAKRVVVDHRTDIYSLGATLYEFLTLQPAFDGKDKQELLRQIAFEEPWRPRRINRAIPRELETIVLKAMDSNPPDRYGSAQELADDLRNFLEDRPILARRPTTWQWVSKWTKRHQVAVLTSAILSFAAALALAVCTAWIWSAKDEKETARAQAQTNYERAEAEQRRADGKSRQSLEEIRAMLELLNDPGKPTQRTFTFLQGLLAESRNDPEGRQLAAQAYLAVGDALQNRHLVQAGEAFVACLAVLKQLADDFPDDAHYRELLGQAQDHLRDTIRWETGYAQSLLGAGRFTEAAPVYDTAFAICTKCAVYLDPSYTRTQLVEIGLWRMRLILKLSGQLSEAEEAFAVVVDRADSKMAEKDVTNKRFWEAMWVAKKADAHTLRGLCRAKAGQLEDAEKDFRQALELAQQAGGLAPKEMNLLGEPVMIAHHALGNLLWNKGQKVSAGREFDMAERGWRALPSSPWRDTELAWLLVTCPDEKRRSPEEAIALAKQATDQPPHVLFHPSQVLGMVSYRNDNWRDAIPALQKARYANAGHDGINYFFLAMAQQKNGKKDIARTFFDQGALWMDKNRPLDVELRRIRAEAADLLGVKDVPPADAANVPIPKP